MAHESRLKVVFDSNRRSRKFHEGWVALLIPRERGMIQKVIDRWMVLRGTALFLFDGNAEESMRNLMDAIPLKAIRGANSVVPGFSQQGFGLEIESSTPDGKRKFTSFLFKRENDRDFWKAFIVALSQGVLPNDVLLLPGQVVSIRDALLQTKEFPPPLGYKVSLVVPPQTGTNQIPQRYDHSVDQMAAEELRRRQAALVERELPLPRGENPSRRGRELFRDVPNSLELMDVRYPERQSSTDPGFHMMQSPRTLVELEPHRTEDPSGWIYMNPSVSVHPFYRDAALNSKQPMWFIDCSRDVAETVLLMGRRFGNVLMRPCALNSSENCYALSYRDDRSIQGVAHILHFSVIRGPNGFKIDVDDEHSPMSCLSDVVQYFIGFVGPGTQPFNSNNLNEILGQRMRTIARPGMQPLQTTHARSTHTSPGISPLPPQLTRSFSSPSKPSPYLSTSGSSSPSYLYMSSSQSLHSPLDSQTSSGSSEPRTPPYSSGIHSPRETRPYETFHPLPFNPRPSISTEQPPSPPSSGPFAVPQFLPAGSSLPPPPPPPPPPPLPEALPSMVMESSTLHRPVKTDGPMKTSTATPAKVPEKQDAFGNFQNELQSKLPKFWQSTYKPLSKP